jgi:hypothetical protein
MQVMDTNISMLDKLNEYDWTYLNGHCNVKIIENLQSNFFEFSEQIKVK